MDKQKQPTRQQQVSQNSYPSYEIFRTPHPPQAKAPENKVKFSVLEEASKLITGARLQDYGHPKDNFQLIATYWSAHLDTNITPEDVAILMALLNVARLKTTPAHRDTQVDICGYVALLEALQTEKDSSL